MRRFPVALATVALAMLLLAAPLLSATLARAAPPLTVFAAASLKEAMDEAAATYSSERGVPVRVSYAASSALARQIDNGAPAHVFVSADLDWMDYLQSRGRVRASDRDELLGNRLVLVAPADPATATVDLAVPGALERALGNGRLAIGQTRSVPAGKYARAALEHLGAWPSLAPRLAESDNVRAALMLVARGEAPLGIVYRTDAIAEPRVRVVAAFPAGSHPPIVYPAAALDGPRREDGRAFVDWLASPAAAAIFRRHGFELRARD
ncbi:molybdate ABC transporter substrate-binding protein [Lysobacter maris]|uniref:Molybdate ABC transporter substrate-binding protein n=1 Tax=Marilutibacter maris TaxID=1605891 RepID=A0A508AMQ5_9GAMM|nr:molybdate ABC transporter substrate-binding protein [Lysobacter maris]KAB8181295.1 molybdate ABC transporter substrate-binding protein [Lysobacter maris]